MHGQITRNLQHLPQIQDKYYFLTHCGQVLLHIFHIYAPILHHCRLVLSTSHFTLKVNVCYTPPVISGPIALIKLNTHKKKKKKKNVVGTPGSSQYIAN